MGAGNQIRSLYWAVGITLFAGTLPPCHGSNDDKQPVGQLVRRWQKEVRERAAKDVKLKALTEKYPLVVLPSRARFDKGGRDECWAFSFIYETADVNLHGNHAQLMFHNGGFPKTFVCGLSMGSGTLTMDLGKADFERNPDLDAISIGDKRIIPAVANAQEGHVYLMRVLDDPGNDFFVLFQIVAVDEEGRYMAFVWRRLPGGKVVKNQ